MSLRSLQMIHSHRCPVHTAGSHVHGALRFVSYKTLQGGSKLGERCAVVAKAGDDQALATFAKLSQKKFLDEAAKRFALGLEEGLDEDDLVVKELGGGYGGQLTELQVQYKDIVKEKLIKRAEEIKAEEDAMKAKLSRNYILGKEAYSCGEYVASIKLLETAVEELGAYSALGGEAQLWLALAYQAAGREQDCVELYKFLETNHPIPKLKRQAADLRYIIEAPKLEISKEERVEIPLISSDTWRQKERRTNYTSSKLPKPAGEKKSTYWDRASWDMPGPPSFLPDKWYVRIAWILLLVGVTIYANFQLSSSG